MYNCNICLFINIPMMWRCLVLFLFIGTTVGKEGRRIGEQMEFQELRKVMRIYCDENKLEAAVQGTLDTIECLIKKMEDTIMAHVFNSPFGGDVVQTNIDIVNSVCSLKNNLTECYNDVVVAMASCSGPWADTAANIKMIQDVFDHVCFNDARTIADFIRNDGRQCVSEQSEGLTNCTANIQIKRSQDSKQLTYSKSCELYDELTGCLMAKVNKCSKKSAAEFFSGIFQIVSESQCSSMDKTKL